MLLAIDTATQTMSLALHDGAELVLEDTWQTSNNHTVELAPAVREALVRAGNPALTGMAVSIGPGTYSGLRVGVALAKAMASARDLPLVGISTLDVLAIAQPHFPGSLVAVVKAGRGRVVTGTYRWRKGRWIAQDEAQVLHWETLLENVKGATIITGEVDEEGREAVQDARKSNPQLTLAPAVRRLRRAGFLAEEAWQRLRADRDSHIAARVTPVYVKTKDSP